MIYLIMYRNAPVTVYKDYNKAVDFINRVIEKNNTLDKEHFKVEEIPYVR